MSQSRDTIKSSKVPHHHYHRGIATWTQGQSTANEAMATKGSLPPVNTRKSNRIDVSDFISNSNQDPNKVIPNLSRSVSRSTFKDGQISITELVKDSKELKPIASLSKHKGTTKDIRTSSPSYNSSGMEYSLGSAHIRRSRIQENNIRAGQQSELTSDSAGYSRKYQDNSLTTPESRNSVILVCW